MIEVQCNVLFLSVFGIELGVRNKRKRVSRMWENAYFSMKNLVSGALKQAPYLQLHEIFRILREKN